jgi:hypothetical protein
VLLRVVGILAPLTGYVFEGGLCDFELAAHRHTSFTIDATPTMAQSHAPRRSDQDASSNHPTIAMSATDRTMSNPVITCLFAHMRRSAIIASMSVLYRCDGCGKTMIGTYDGFYWHPPGDWKARSLDDWEIHHCSPKCRDTVLDTHQTTPEGFKLPSTP